MMQLSKKNALVVLAIVYTLLRLPLLGYLPFIQDENLYAEMIEEQLANPTPVPKFLGYTVAWKPQLTFWLYAPFAAVLKNFSFVPLEAVYRLPSFVFGFINVILLYYIIYNTIRGEHAGAAAFFTALIYSISGLSVYVNNTVLTDTLLQTFIFASLLCYVNKNWGEKKFISAGFFAFCAFFTKLAVAAIIPLLALVYFYINDKKIISNKFFLVSLLAVPLAALAYYAAFSPEEKKSVEEVYFLDTGRKLDLQSTEGIQTSIFNKVHGSVILFFLLTGIWLSLSFYGLYKNWKDNPWIAFWYSFIIFPILSGTYMPWYYLPVLPPISFFAFLVLGMNGKAIKLDRFFLFALVIFTIASTIMLLVYYQHLSDSYTNQKEVGKLLVGKENVLFIGSYAPAAIFYKILEERRANGKFEDFGWVLMLNQENMDKIGVFLSDYHTKKYQNLTTNGSFETMFWKKDLIYRKNTSLNKFDYFIIVGTDNAKNRTVNYEITKGEVFYNKSGITAIRLS